MSGINSSILTPTGERIEAKPGIDYLGSVLSHDGLPGHELGRRIGMAKSRFSSIAKSIEALCTPNSPKNPDLQSSHRIQADVQFELFVYVCS